MIDDIFNQIKKNLLTMDPVFWAEENLTLDGKPYRLTDSGYKPIVDILRYIAIKALAKDGKPLIWVKSRQIGGSTTALVAEMYFMGCGLFGNEQNPPIRVAHLWPTLDRAFDYSKTKLASIIDSSRIIDTGKKSRPLMRSLFDTNSTSNDSAQFKQFKGGNHLWIESAGLDGSRLRGKTIDVLFSDEIQEIPQAAIANSIKTLTKAQYGSIGNGVQVYFGTPLQRGSEFWNLWNKSSQQYYHLGCESCGKNFPLYTPNSNEWETIWLYENIVKCTHCGKEQNKIEAVNRGRWIASREADDCPFIGFHFNQLYIPEFTKEKIISMKPENNPLMTERAYQNEVLGEFFQGETAIITPDQIRDLCGDPERKFRQSIPADENILTFIGIDIGKKADYEQLANSDKVKSQGQSYSTAVILSVSGVGRLSVEFASKFKRNNWEAKKEFVDELIKRYNPKLVVCDIGYAHDFCEIMQTAYGEKFLASDTKGAVKEKVKFDPDIFPKTISFEKDFWIMEMYEQLRRGMVRFPLGSYEMVAWLMQHCSNMEIKTSISRTGDVTPHYVKSGTNDGFAALINAYLAYKFYVSKGFTIKNPLLQVGTFEQKKKPSVIAAYSSR